MNLVKGLVIDKPWDYSKAGFWHKHNLFESDAWQIAYAGTSTLNIANEY